MGIKKHRKKQKQRARLHMRKDYEQSKLLGKSPAAGPAAKKAKTDEDVAPIRAPSGLDIYWHLASLRRPEREVAARALLNELLTSAGSPGGDEGGSHKGSGDSGDGEEDASLAVCPPAVQYALPRLIKGMASSRGGARQGFSLALTGVLRHGEKLGVSPDLVLRLIPTHLPKPTGASKGQEASEALLGQLFVLSAIVHSGSLAPWTEKDKTVLGAGGTPPAPNHTLANVGKEAKPSSLAPAVPAVVDALLSLFSAKSFLREPAAALLMELVEQVPSSLRKHMLSIPSLRAWLGGAKAAKGVENESEKQADSDGGNMTAEHLAVSLKLWNVLPEKQRPKLVTLCKPLLPSVGNGEFSSALFSRKHLETMLPALLVKQTAASSVAARGPSLPRHLQDSSHSHPTVNAVWALLLDHLLKPQSPTLPSTSKGKTPHKTSKSPAKDPGPSELSLRSLSTFWDVVVDRALLPSSHERRFLALQLLCLLLPRLPLGAAPVVLSRAVVRCLVDVLPSKEAHLHRLGVKCVESLSLWAQQSASTRIAVLLALEKHSGGKFDLLTRSHAVRRLSAGLDRAEDGSEYLSFLKGMFLKGPAGKGEEGGEEGESTNGMGKKKKGKGETKGQGCVPMSVAESVEGDAEAAGPVGDEAWQQWAMEQMLKLVTSAPKSASEKAARKGKKGFAGDGGGEEGEEAGKGGSVSASPSLLWDITTFFLSQSLRGEEGEGKRGEGGSKKGGEGSESERESEDESESEEEEEEDNGGEDEGQGALEGSIGALLPEPVLTSLCQSGIGGVMETSGAYKAPAKALTARLRSECRGRFLAALNHVVSAAHLRGEQNQKEDGATLSEGDAKSGNVRLWEFRADLAQALVGIAWEMQKEDVVLPLRGKTRVALWKMSGTARSMALLERELSKSESGAQQLDKDKAVGKLSSLRLLLCVLVLHMFLEPSLPGSTLALTAEDFHSLCKDQMTEARKKWGSEEEKVGGEGKGKVKGKEKKSGEPAKGVTEEVGVALGEDDDGVGMAVLVDVLLALLAHPSASLRASASGCFSCHCEMLTETGLKDIVRVVIKSPFNSGRRQWRRGKRERGEAKGEGYQEIEEALGVLEGEGEWLPEEEEEGEEAWEMEKEEEEGEEGEESEGEEKEDGEESEDDGKEVESEEGEREEEDEGDELEFEGKGNSNSGKNRKGVEEEEERGSESDDGIVMDDEAMFRIDRQLANIVRLRAEKDKKGKRSKRELVEMQHFRLRALSLLDTWLKKCPDSPLVLRCPVPLLRAASNAYLPHGGGHDVVLLRISRLLESRIVNGRSYPKGPGVSLSLAQATMKGCMAEAIQAATVDIARLAGSLAVWALRVVKAVSPEVSVPPYNEAVQVTFDLGLTCALNRRTCPLTPAFFADSFNRQLWLPAVVLPTLLRLCHEGRSEFVCGEAMKLLLPFLRRRPSVPHFQETLAQNMDQVQTLLVTLPTANYTKRTRLEAALQLTLALLEAASEVGMLGECDLGEVEKVVKVATPKCEKHRTTTFLERLKKRIQELKRKPATPKEDKKSTKRKAEASTEGKGKKVQTSKKIKTP